MPAPMQQQKRRRPRTRYGIQLHEKQELKSIFGIREEQLRGYFKKALRAKGETGPVIISLLERRLDNAIFRAGFAQTRKQSRQMATHRLFEVNGRAVDIPSYQLRKGDTVHVREGKRTKSYFNAMEKRLQNAHIPSWIELDSKGYGFTIVEEPTAQEANVGVDIRAIVEFFAR